jgi:hypothetical protein
LRDSQGLPLKGKHAPHIEVFRHFYFCSPAFELLGFRTALLT